MSMLESKLLTALSELGNAAGSGLKSDGVGAPPDELVKAFADSMQNTGQDTPQAQDFLQDSETFEQNGQNSQHANEQHNFEHKLIKGPAESMPALSSSQETAPSQSVNNRDIPSIQEVTNVQEGQSLDPRASYRMDNAQGTSSFASEVSKPLGQDASSKELIQELETILQKISEPGNMLGQLELYRAQYIMGMLKMQAHTGMKVSQSTSQGLESLLKQKE